jgi:spermidine synthase
MESSWRAHGGSRVGAALVVLGAYAQVAQAVLAREALVAFFGNEVSLGAFFGGWLLWVAAGAGIALGLRERLSPAAALATLRGLLLAMPGLLVLQVLAARLVRLALDVPALELIPLGQLVLATLAVTLPTSLALGLAFPIACEALTRDAPRPGRARSPASRAVATVSGLYVLESVGALLGGLLFTFVLLESLGVWRSVGLVSAALAVTALALRPARVAGTLAAAIAVAGLAVAVSPLGPSLDRLMERVRFAALQPGLELLEAVDTRYGHVALARRADQFSRVVDGRVAESWPDPARVQAAAALFFAEAGSPRRLLLFGALVDGLAAELLRYPVERVTAVETDPRAFEATRRFLDPATRAALADPRLTVHFGDGREHANRLRADDGYDLVLVLGVDPSTAQSNRYFTRELYQRVAAAMAPGGVLCTAVSGASNYLGREVRSYGASVYRTLGEVFAEVVATPGDVNLFCAARRGGVLSTDPAVIEDRYRSVPLAGTRLAAESFANLLEPRRIKFLLEHLRAGGELNTDSRPVAYYLNMVLWGKLSASGFAQWMQDLRLLGPWPYLVPIAVLAVLLPLRAALEGTEPARVARQAATLALAAVGFVAMAAQLALLYAYQAHLGFVFSRIALLNAVFMTGLALGAGLLGQRWAGGGRAHLRLAALMASVALGLLALGPALQSLAGLEARAPEGFYLSLSTGLGVLTGAAYPLGVALARRGRSDLLSPSGLAQAADHLGGALGGLVCGALLVPLLGTDGTLGVLAGVLLASAVPAVLAGRAGTAPAFLRVRGHRAFPANGLSWGLAVAVISAGVLVGVGPERVPPPITRVGEETLAAASGSGHFELRESPFLHYLGTGSGGSARARPGADAGAPAPLRTVSLASRAVVGDVRGHGGPINLLVSVDESGVLRGVRYLESNETPAYVDGIEAWLAGLAGHDLGRAALGLGQYDALSGATVTSRAALETVNRAAAKGAEAAFGRRLAAAAPAGTGGEWSAGHLAVLALLLAFLPVYRSGRDGPRLLYQAAALGVLGLWLNALPSEADLVAASLGRWPGLPDGLLWYALGGFALVSALLFGPAYCGYLCPFGALQELLSRAGRHLRLRRYADRAIDTPLRQVKYLLLALVLLAAWSTGDGRFASFNPMQHAFGGRLSGWLLVLTALALAGSLVYYRCWCRYLCPFGAFLALFNKVALAQRLGPARRFDHCDLGVRDLHDVDCIRCHRCVTGRDFGLRPAPEHRGGQRL